MTGDWSGGNVVGIMSRLRAGRSRVRILVGARDFSLLQNVQTDVRAHPVSYSMGTGFFPPG
jgi:hypothetical protein